MLEISMPGGKPLQLSHLILDYNGTLARDGSLMPGVRERLQALSPSLQLHVVTGNTFGNAQTQLRDIPCELAILAEQRQAEAKLAYLQRFGPPASVCIGNGRNDRLMLEAAAVGIAVIQQEGAASAAILAADIVTTSMYDALDLLANPLRLVATLRE